MQGALHVHMSHLGVFEQSILLYALSEHQAVLAVSGPVQQVLHEVLVILKDPLCIQSKSRPQH